MCGERCVWNSSLWDDVALQNVECFDGFNSSGESASRHAGMALYIFTCGFIVFLASLIVYTLPVVRNMEADLPDYQQHETEIDAMPKAT